MTREQARSILGSSRRFQVTRGRIVVRDAELAGAITAVKAERRPSFEHGRGAFVSS